MAQDEDFADLNAHERTPGKSSSEPSPSEPSSSEASSSQASSNERDDRAGAKPGKDEKNPLNRLRFGSAGSGGAELEPGPERP